MYILTYQFRTDKNDSDFTLYSLKWLRKKSQISGNPGKDMEQWEHSSIAGGSANLYSLRGNQLDSVSENWK